MTPLKDPMVMAREIQDVVPRKYKGVMEGAIHDLEWVAPECRLVRMIGSMQMFMHGKAYKDWHFAVESIITGKSVDELKKNAQKIKPWDDPDFGSPILHAWEGDKVIAVENYPERGIWSGQEYTIDRVEVYAASSYVTVKESPGAKLNAIMFEIKK